jgi:hypothetical protein
LKNVQNSSMTEEEKGVENTAVQSVVVAEDENLHGGARGVKREREERGETTKSGRDVALVPVDFPDKHALTPGTGVQPPPHTLPGHSSGDPFSLHHSIGMALRSMEELNRLKDIAALDPAGVQHSLRLGEVDRMLPAEELVAMIHGLISNVMPGLFRDLDALMASITARYGVAPVAMQGTLLQQAMLRQMMESPQLPEPLVPAVPELSREAMLGLYGPPVAVVEKKMSNREYMSRFRLNTKFVSNLLPVYDHTSSVPTIYGAIERLLCADITICTVDGRAYKVVYELARTVKNDWLHHRFTAGWAEVVKQLGIEIGDLLIFERWTEDRTLLTMQIVKERQMSQQNPQYAWLSRPMTAAERKGQF